MSGPILNGFEGMIKNLKDAPAKQREKVKRALNSVLAEMVNFIKSNSDNWKDRTGNLRNSISYVPAFDGTPSDYTEISKMVSGTDVSTGRNTVSKKTDLVAAARGNSDSITGIIYAGMEYAIYVEYNQGNWVISGAFTQFHSKILALVAERVRAQK